MKTPLGAAKAQIKSALRAVDRVFHGPRNSLAPDLWNLTDDPSSGLALQGVPLESLLRKWGSPLYVVDANSVRSHAQRFLSPNGAKTPCEVFFSYKTNPVPAVLRLLHDEGIGAEVISHYELWLARTLGVPPDRIVYNGPGKSLESIRDAILADVLIINANHTEEIARIAAVARSLGRRPRIGIRVTTGEGWTSQFGVPVQGGAALAAYTEALSHEVLDVIGIHAHLGGMIRTQEALLANAEATLDLVEEIENRVGISLEILNFGGSLATPTVEHLNERDIRRSRRLLREIPRPKPESCITIEEFVTTLANCVSSRYRKRGRRLPRIFIEPGRSMTGSTIFLLSTVISTKKAREENFLILDAGINLADPVRTEFHQMFPIRGWNEPKVCSYSVVGPICTPADTLYYAWKSRELREGDAVAIMDAGAYFIPFSTSFSYPRPAIAMIDNGQASMIRRAETFEDLVARDSYSPGTT